MSDDRARRSVVLNAAAKAKSQAKTSAADQAIRTLVARGEPITFQAISREAGVSHALLYGQQDLRRRIEHLRAQAQPGPAPHQRTETAETTSSSSPPRSTDSRSRTARRSTLYALPWNKPTERTSGFAANSPAAAAERRRPERQRSAHG